MASFSSYVLSITNLLRERLLRFLLNRNIRSLVKALVLSLRANV
jgi:hypothetical protein